MRWLAVLLVGLGGIFWVAAQSGRSDAVHPPANVQAQPTQPQVTSTAVPVWALTGFVHMPKVYYQGVTADPHENLYFDGIFSGLYRTNPSLRETARNDDVIPPSVRGGEGYNHIGDISWDSHEGGRLMLPLDCFHPNLRQANTCGSGAIGVADPRTLTWRYYVKLDRRDIRKATWNEVSPDGKLLWTASGKTLLAYRTSDIKPANAGPGGEPIRPVRRIRGAVPPSGITGAAFYDGRLFVAGSNRGKGPFQVWSISTLDGSRVLEIARPIVGESEGLGVSPTLGGTLHWQIMPFNPERQRPTYGYGHATLLQFVLVGACANVVAGTGRGDTVRGTRTGDKPLGTAGDDDLIGFGGRDCLFGRAGADTLAGGTGDDELVGGRGHDRLMGGAGDDIIVAGDGASDTVDCGAGRDTVYADASDRLTGCEKKVIRRH